MKAIVLCLLTVAQCASVSTRADYETSAIESEQVFRNQDPDGNARPVAGSVEALKRRVAELEAEGLRLVRRYRALGAQLDEANTQITARDAEIQKLRPRAEQWDRVVRTGWTLAIGALVCALVAFVIFIARRYYGGPLALTRELPARLLEFFRRPPS